MASNSSPTAAFHDMVRQTFLSSGMKAQVHTVLVNAIINAMTLFSASGTQARFRGTNIVDDVLSMSEQVIMLSVCLNINIKFRFNNILELPMNIIADGHIVGFDSVKIYFKNKASGHVPPEELERAQILFNFISIVRHLSGLLGPQGILDLVEDFKKPVVASTLPDRKVTRSRSRRYGICQAPLCLLERRPLSSRNSNTIPTSNSGHLKNSCKQTSKQHNRSKRHARIWNDENTQAALEAEKRESNKRKFLAGFI